jgi:hypothetical protein
MEEPAMELILLTVPGCPNAAAFEERLAAALAGQPGVTVTREDIADERAAAQAGMHGSPTLLIGGTRPSPHRARPPACRVGCTGTTRAGPPRLRPSRHSGRRSGPPAMPESPRARIVVAVGRSAAGRRPRRFRALCRM